MSQKNVQKIYPLTPMQEGMLYHAELDPDSLAYFTQLELGFSGDFNLSLLQKSIDELVRCYDILRTVFVHQKLQRPRQVVFGERKVDVHFEDISRMDSQAQEQYLSDFKQDNQSKGFDLAKGQLFRVTVFQLGENEYRFLWSNHHIIIDGWSLGNLMKRLFENYEALRQNHPLPRSPEHPYADYVKWLEKQDRDSAFAYWESRLNGFDEPTSLPMGNHEFAEAEYQNEQFTFIWDEHLVAALTELANLYQVTVPNLFQAMWGALLARYNNTDDVAFGTVVSGRSSAVQGIENMVGLFINTIPVRLQMNRQDSFSDVCRIVQQNAIEAEKYDYIPLYDIQNHSQLDQGLVNHLLAFENYPLDERLADGDFNERLGFSAQVLGSQDQTNYDFNLVVFPGATWTIKMMYNACVYDRGWIEKVSGHLTSIARGIAADADVRVGELPMLSDGETSQLLYTFNNTSATYPDDKTIQQLFEEQAQRVPDKIAVSLNGTQMTYHELNRQANGLAVLLREKGIARDNIVAVMVERSVEMIVAILGVLKSGGAYLPIDPTYPEDRIRFMLDDSGTELLLTQSHLVRHVEFRGETLDITTHAAVMDEEHYEAIGNLEHVNSPDDLCYIIYTSGTTGRPKGVMTSHRNVVRLLFNDKMPFDFSERDTWTMFHSFCFDFSVWEMYGALLRGGKLVIVPKHVAQSPNEFRQLLIEQQVTVLNQTPSAFALLMQREWLALTKQLELRYVVFGGEALKPLMLKEWYEQYPSTKLINMYGITETTVHVTFKEICEEEIQSNISNIGCPIPTLSCYILDKDLQLLPAGVVGELCVGGLGVARGYLHRQELSDQRFIDNPYKPGERLYRSGDSARFLPNGELEYFGRMDHQVKIRGFRIELGEIEHVLLQHEAIRSAAVLARTDYHGHPFLCAYIVPDGTYGVAQIRADLQKNLPDYMVPEHFIEMPAMPLTANGKLDSKGLPEPAMETVGETYRAPTNATQQILANIWQDILGLNQVGIDDNFFTIGGHSLKAMLLSTKVHQVFELELPIKVLFERPTIFQLASYLDSIADDGSKDPSTPFVPIDKAPDQPCYPVSSAQRRMYILNQLNDGGTSYNLPAALLLQGDLDKSRLENAFQQLILRHEILRTSFEITEGTLVQKIHDDVPFHLNQTVVSKQAIDVQIRDFVRPFDLQEAPLVRAELVQCGNDSHILLLDMHHIISDGASTSILIRELTQLYERRSLTEPKLHYKDFAVWQNSEVQQEGLKQLEEYWVDTFSGELPVLELPTDFNRPMTPSFVGSRFNFGIDKELTRSVSKVLEDTDTTLYMFLLAALNVFLAKYGSQEDIIVGSPVAGRSHAEIQDVPGMFVNTLALRNTPKGGKTFKQFLLEVKDTTLQALAHQDYPFEELVEKLSVSQDTTQNPLFNVMFNVLNMELSTLRLGNVNISPYGALPIPAKFDLSLEAAQQDEEIALAFDFATELYKEETIRRWSRHFVQIVRMVVTHPHVRIRDLELLTPDERRDVLQESQGTGVDYPVNHTIHALFEETASNFPNRVAIDDGEICVTFSELNSRAQSLANVLRHKGVTAEDPIALFLHRSADTIVAILAILKAGGAYVPIDIDNPEERVRFMLGDSGARYVITEDKYRERVGRLCNCEIIHIHDGMDTRVNTVHAQHDACTTRLAYVIYTSGTTGQPKGVMIEHRQVIHLMEALRDRVYSRYPSMGLNLALVAPFHFDASVQQIFSSLLLGHTLFIVPKSVSVDGQALVEYYRSNHIDVTDGTPTHVQMLVATRDFEGVRLRHMIVGGEALPYETVGALARRFVQTTGVVPVITNAYGPTECCVDASIYDVEDTTEGVPVDRPYVPIGRPLGNNRMYIVDAYDHLLPTGVPGELCIAGDGVGRGYWNLTRLTEEKFSPDPFVAGETMYRTGDLVCKRADGTIDYLGRMDNQVKIRGYRIELGEIETAMLKVSDVNQTVVVAVHDMQELCAYFTADSELSSGTLREILSEKLPKYMIPTYFVQLEAIPLTANGKMDVRSLRTPESRQEESDVDFAAAQTEIEKQLCVMWQDVLGMNRVGMHDDFFDLGGHSLKAMILIGHIQQRFGQDIPLKALFEAPTIREFAYRISTHETHSYDSISPAKKQDYYPVSPAQKRMYVLHEIEHESISYNMPSVVLMEGDLDIPRLRHALQGLVERYEILRTSFDEVDGIPVQRIEHSIDIDLSLKQCSESEVEAEIRKFIRPFKLMSEPLVRARLLALSHDRHLFLLDMHHIISDGQSITLFIDDMARLYKGEELQAPTVHYKDYTTWLTEAPQQTHLLDDKHYWIEQFTEKIEPLHLPLDFPRPSVKSSLGDVVRFHAPREVSTEIETLMSQTGTTFHMVVLATLNILLQKLSGQDDIVVGSAVTGRTHPDVMDMPGMFVNALALRNAPKSDRTFSQFLQEVKETSLDALAHQDYPFEELVGQLDLLRDLSRNPLFDVMLTVENPQTKPLTLERLDIRPYEVVTGTSKFDLTLAASQSTDGIVFQFEYATSLFKSETIHRWGQYLLNVVRAVVENPDIHLSDIELLTAREKHQLLNVWNQNEMKVPTDKTVHQLFEEQVIKTPDDPAITFNGHSYTYRELNSGANRVARMLIHRGIQADDCAGIMVKPSLDMVVGALGILKAGAAFVPIDPSYPEGRVSYILDDSGAKVLLTQTDITVPAKFNREVMLLDGHQGVETEDMSAVADGIAPAMETASNNLAYIVYTSGTTGKPKGVMVEHRSLVNLCYWHNEAFAVSEHDRSAKYAGFGFDASVWEMFPYLLAGANIHVIDESIRLDIVQLNEYFERHQVTIAFLPTQLCEQFMEEDNQSLRVLLTGGDKLKQVQTRGRYILVNNYGPTEGTVVATSTVIKPETETLAIGRPIANTRAYILGDGNRVQPVGVAGELYIAGRGLARGYMNRPEETAHRFVADPFVPGERMYRTGDLVRWLEDGRIEYIGRIDQQVKVRGFRIELSEIEVNIVQHSSVQAAVVVDAQDAHGNTTLCAYVVIADGIEMNQLKFDLAHVLPEYMLPQYWVSLDALPLTQNGKVDRKALPAPDVAQSQVDYEAPQDEMETVLASIWQDILGLDSIGREDNFFALGGDSIKAIQIASRLHKLGWKLEMKDLFQHPSIGQVTPYLQAQNGRHIDQNPVEGDVPLSPIQRWFFEQDYTDMHHYNQSVMLHAPRGLDASLVRQTLTKLVEHHDALRMVYENSEDTATETSPTEGLQQYNRGLDHDSFSLDVFDLRDEANPEDSIQLRASQTQRSIHLSHGPLVKCSLYRTEDGDHLLIVIHHLIVDGVSWRILLEDFATGYLQAQQGQPIVYQDKSSSLRDWMEGLRAYANSYACLNEIQYWKATEQQHVGLLPKDTRVNERRQKDSSTVSFELSEDETRLLLTKVHTAYGTEMNDILLSALGLTVKSWTGDNAVCITLEGHGREEIVEGMDISRTVGWFTSQYPVVLRMESGDIRSQIKTVKETLRNVPNKGVGYGILRYLTDTSYTCDLDFSLCPEISFNYLGQFANEVQTDFFKPSALTMGQQTSPQSELMCALNFSGIVRDERLVISCSYDKREFLIETIAELVDSFEEHLLALIDHCVNKEDRDFTPSDFTARGLEMDEVGDIFDLLSEKWMDGRG